MIYNKSICWIGKGPHMAAERVDELCDNFLCPSLANAVAVIFFTVQLESDHDNG